MTHHHEHATDPRRIRAVGDILARGIRRVDDIRHRRIVAESAATSLDLVAEPSVTVPGAGNPQSDEASICQRARA
jgi:hypothetical protein